MVAVEPDERMRALHGEALAGSAEAIPLEDASVDAVFVGEAFHWFDTGGCDPGDRARAHDRAAGLAILWTHWWETEPPLPERGARAAARAVAALRESQRRPPWDGAFEGSPFEPMQVERDIEDAIMRRAR